MDTWPFLFVLLATLACTSDAALLGGAKLLTIDELDQEPVRSLLHHAVASYNARSNSWVYYGMHRVQKATVQTVAGQLYRFTLVLVPTQCNKGLAPHLLSPSLCKPRPGISRICRFTMWLRLWLESADRLRITIDQCSQIKGQSLLTKPMLLDPQMSLGVVSLFNEFKMTYNKSYTREEHAKRFVIFRQNMLNAYRLQELDKGTAEYGITQFSDLSPEEFKKIYLPMKWDLSIKPNKKAEPKPITLPKAFDWREHGAVTEIKNQGMCGSCWAFSVTGNVEGQWFLAKKKLISLSEQQLVDCDHKDHGCSGGLPEWAYNSTEQMGGLMSEADYPYKAREQDCRLDPKKIVAYINSSVELPTDEEKLASWLVQHGPISVGINAMFMQFYIRGISHPPHFLCPAVGIDHGVLIVGYGVSSILGRPYWIIKNSWGSFWGERGYFRVYRGDGTCGVNQMCTSALVQ